MALVELYTSVWNAALSAQVATIGPRPVDRVIRRLIIVGPDASKFSLYEGLIVAEPFLRTTTGLGLRNTANLNPPLLLPAGAGALAVWSGGSTSAATTARVSVESDVGGSSPGG